jgi:hypothetical protein
LLCESVGVWRWHACSSSSSCINRNQLQILDCCRYVFARALVLSPKNIFRGRKEIIDCVWRAGYNQMRLASQFHIPLVAQNLPFQYQNHHRCFLDLALSAKLEMRLPLHSYSFGDRKHASSTGEIFSILYTSHQKDWLNVSIAAAVLFQRENG